MNAYLKFLPVKFASKKQGAVFMHKVYCDRYMYDTDRGKAHLLSIVGQDSMVSGFLSEIQSTDKTLSLRSADGSEINVSFSEKPLIWKGALTVPGNRKALRHILVASDELYQGKDEQGALVLNHRPDIAWATLVNLYGLPALPEWGSYITGLLKRRHMIQPLKGHNCSPVRIIASEEQILEWISNGLRKGTLKFPTENGPVEWPRWSVAEALALPHQTTRRAA